MNKQYNNIVPRQITPLGEFPSDFDFSDKNSSLLFLCQEKNQLLEGLVIEKISEKIMSKLVGENDVKIIDVVILIAKGVPESRWDDTPDQYCSFIWNRGNDEVEDLIGIFKRMAKNSDRTTFICKEDDGYFWISKPDHHDFKPLQEYLKMKREINGQSYSFPQVTNNLKDIDRQLSAIYGLLSPVFSNLVRDVVYPRVFKNYMIQPFFRTAWDLDRIFRYKSKLWEFELKHKYPIDNYDFFTNALENPDPEHRLCLSFGINEGQARLIKMLSKQGLKTLHVIIVKPRWNDNEESNYLFMDDEARRRTLVIGTVFSTEKISEVLRGKRLKGNSKTTLTGIGNTYYYRIPRNAFHILGSYSDGDQAISSNIKKLLDGNLNHPLSSKDLLDACMERKLR